jgi:hypothetical protein
VNNANRSNFVAFINLQSLNIYNLNAYYLKIVQKGGGKENSVFELAFDKDNNVFNDILKLLIAV